MTGALNAAYRRKCWNRYLEGALIILLLRMKKGMDLRLEGSLHTRYAMSVGHFSMSCR